MISHLFHCYFLCENTCFLSIQALFFGLTKYVQSSHLFDRPRRGYLYNGQFKNNTAMRKRIDGVDYLGFKVLLPSASGAYLNNLNKLVVVQTQSKGTYATKTIFK